MILGELARISDHLTCTGAMAMELGAITPFLWWIKAREMVWDILEEETGARLTHSFGRIGGMASPPTPNLKEMLRAAVPTILHLLEEGEKLLLKNRIFIDRLENVGIISADDAKALGWTGPCLRATGVAYDIRKSFTSTSQARRGRLRGPRRRPRQTRMDRFPSPVRLSVEDPHEHARILLQCADRMPDDGPVNVTDPRFVFPNKTDVYTTIEATIQHFKLVMEGAKVPKGECYSYTEWRA